MFLGRCTFPRFCAKWCSNSVAHGTSLSSSRSFNLYPKLTQLAPFYEINSTVFWASDLAACEASINWILLGLLYLKAETQIFLIAISFIPFGSGWLEEHLKWNRHDELSLVFDIKVWKWNETASDREQLHKILAALWSEGCLSWLMSIEHKSLSKSLYAKLPNKKVDRCAFPRLRAYEAQTSAACQVPEGKTSLICFVLARYGACGWGPLTFGTNFGSASAACPLIKTGDKLHWLSELSDLYP